MCVMPEVVTFLLKARTMVLDLLVAILCCEEMCQGLSTFPGLLLHSVFAS